MGILSCSCSPLVCSSPGLAVLPWRVKLCRVTLPVPPPSWGSHSSCDGRDVCVLFCWVLPDLIPFIPEFWGHCSHGSYWIPSHGKGCVSYQGGNHRCQGKLLISSFLKNARHPGRFALGRDGRFRTEHNPCYQTVIMRANTCLCSS